MVDQYQSGYGANTQTAADSKTFDAGLRKYMLRVYNYMTSGVLLTGIVALLTASSPTMLNAIYNSGLQWIVALAPLGFVFAISFGVNRFSSATLQVLFWVFAAVMGLSLSYIFLVYTDYTI